MQIGGASQKLRSVQVLRAVAVTGVVACHAASWPLGACGVDLFFAISGFVISQSAERHTPGRFLAERLVRIYPAYWLNLLPWLVIAALSDQIVAGRLFTSLTLWPITGGFMWPYLAPGWTLSFEMLFYLAMTISIALQRPALPLLAYAGCFTANLIFPSALGSFVGSPMIISFLIGTAIAKSARTNIPVLWIIAGIAALSFSGNAAVLATMPVGVNGYLALPRLISWGFPAAAILYGAVSLETMFSPKWLNALVGLGDASYSIYLVHFLALQFIPVAWPLKIAGTLAIGWVLYEAVEKPIVRAGKTGLESALLQPLMSWRRRPRTTPVSITTP